MTRRVPQRIVLSFVCALALILIPVAYSPVWGQSTYSSTTTQQDKTDQNVDQNQNKQDLNQTQTQTNQDLNQTQSNQSSPDVNSSTGTRDKPDSSVNDPNSQNQNQSQTEYNQNQNQNQNQPDYNRQPSTGSQTYSGSQTTTPKSSSATATEQNTDQSANQSASNQDLPKTAGELPLILLIGLLSLGTAAGTRLLAHVRSNR